MPTARSKPHWTAEHLRRMKEEITRDGKAYYGEPQCTIVTGDWLFAEGIYRTCGCYDMEKIRAWCGLPPVGR